VEGSGAAETFAARSVDRVAGAFGATIAFEAALRPVFLVGPCRERRAKTNTSAAHDR